MSQETIFRFMAVRAARSPEPRRRTPATPLYKDSGENSAVVAAVASAQSQNKSSAQVKAAAAEFKKAATYFAARNQIPETYHQWAKWCFTNIGARVSELDIAAQASSVFGQPLAELVSSQGFLAIKAKLADTVFIDALVPNTDAGREPDDFVFLFKALSLLTEDYAAHGELLLGTLLDRVVVQIPAHIRVRKEMPALPTQKPPAKLPSDKSLRDRLKALSAAHRELTRIAKDSSFREQVPPPRVPVERPTPAAAGPLGLNTSFLSHLQGTSGLNVKLATSGEIPLSFGLAAPALVTAPEAGRYVMAKSAIKGLSAPTRTAVKAMRIDLAATPPTKAVALVENEIGFVAGQLAAPTALKEVVLMGGGYLDKTRFLEAIRPTFALEVLWDVLSRCQFDAGVGDLLIVKQVLKAYELADFAHVENVLAGELRDRQHRRLSQREEIIINESETETEKERSLQTTERNEMQNEAEKTVKEQTQLDAGLQVSGSYGPTISFTASLNAGFSTQTEETQKKATSYSREVTEKTSDKIRERVRNERRVRTLEEIEEINKHSINNSDASNGHIRGIYRWLNKVYDAQVLNYGKRMMYEFVIPEPAAYFLYTMVDNPPQQTTLIKPEPPTYLGHPLQPKNLTRVNYHDYVSQYHIENAPVPPSEFTVVSFFDKQDGKDPNNFGRSSKLSIPDGYEAYAAVISSYKTFIEGQDKGLKIMVGGTSVNRDGYWGAEYFSLGETYRGEIAVSVGGFQICSFVVSVDVFCSLTDEAFAKWQQKMYDSIISAYHVQKSDYDEKVTAAEIQKGVQILGRNPMENRRIEREELKKWIIMMLNNSPYLALNGFNSSLAEPVLDIHRSCQQGSFIRFFENAFEWNNMTYIFYPYFWGRKAKWNNALHLTDPDLDFAAFLKAGAARVQLPVRPGFEKAVAHFCQFGEIWQGNEVPLRGDNLYVPIIDEITESLGKIEEGVPYPEDSEPWEVIVPTSLVVLQDMEEIPGIRDALTGENIDLENKNP